MVGLCVWNSVAGVVCSLMWLPWKCVFEPGPNVALLLSTATGDADGEAIEMAFSKKKVEDRKAWLTAFEPGTFLDMQAQDLSYEDFVNKVGGWMGQRSHHVRTAVPTRTVLVRCGL